MPIFSSTTNVSYQKSFYTLAIILLTILFLYFLQIALYHCPKVIMATREKGRKKTKPKAPQEAS